MEITVSNSKGGTTVKNHTPYDVTVEASNAYYVLDMKTGEFYDVNERQKQIEEAKKQKDEEQKAVNCLLKWLEN